MRPSLAGATEPRTEPPPAPAHPCPLCSGPLLELCGFVRCPRCHFAMCAGCEGEALGMTRDD